jgi:hypothetical protein
LKIFSENWRLFIISVRLFDEFFREMEALIINLRLFTFSIELRLFKDFGAF